MKKEKEVKEKKEKEELYKKYRPRKLSDIIGQPEAVNVLQSFIDNKSIPHALLFSGSSGCGKTTLARILKRKLNCGDYDFTELNCADANGIAMTREIRSRLNQSPISGKCRIWLLDECHKLTTDAQSNLLKMLEDTPKHVYFMLATTEPEGLKNTIRTRCTQIVVNNLQDKEMSRLLSNICIQENISISKKVSDKIIEYCEGSARKALVILNQIINLKSEKEMLDAITNTTAEAQGKTIAQLLLTNFKWAEIAITLRLIKNEDCETIRYGVLGYMKAVLLSGNRMSEKAFVIIQTFSEPFYNSKLAGLTAACYEIMINTK